MIELKTATEIDRMREAGRVVAATLEAVRRHAQAGVSLAELDEVARAMIEQAGAKPAFLHYWPNWAPSPFPGVICTSVNDVVVHGIPGPYRLAEGDVVSIDCGASVDGWHGDAAVTFPIGPSTQQDRMLLETTQAALQDGIAAAVPGNRIGDVSRAIGVVGRSGGYGIPDLLGGHGIGRRMHEAPFVPNDGRAGQGTPLRPGMVLAIEPMLLTGGRDSFEYAADGWSLHTGDGTRSAHMEHTVAITEHGPRVLTIA
ncbi:type I methionyl aminopeptidase [Haloactinomyces albus]|uniref:type I methionyl aminopeptidase n=1 Tax=Haloactinomyces albus TaxID=1352928 RepID=UPI0035B5417E